MIEANEEESEPDDIDINHSSCTGRMGEYAIGTDSGLFIIKATASLIKKKSLYREGDKIISVQHVRAKKLLLNFDELFDYGRD